ncbi:MAG: hypothetical protein OXQ89_03005 [Rhodospirillaceae bacterium]|nr:hypothetical protein [Rhodospirillaceae bacterium]
MTSFGNSDIESGPGADFLGDTVGIEDVFGPTSIFYVPLVRQVIPRVFDVDYDFEDTRVFNEKAQNGVYGPEDLNRIVWREILFRAHIVVSVSLYRTCRLIDATVREHRASNLPGWASCTRALLEAIGDSFDALQAIPVTLAENHRFIRRCLSGQVRQYSGSKELEDKMIHFTHARHLKREEKDRVPASHKAKPAGQYISEIGIPGARTLYGELCEYSHPTASSVQYLFSVIDEGKATRVDPLRDEHKISSLIETYRTVFNNVLMVSFNPVLLSLRVFDAFQLFPNILELRNVNFSNIPAWAIIEKHLK